ncbi:uncharacterized protein LOC120334223 [Styela clava]
MSKGIMTDENEKRYSRLPETAGKRAASLNQHLGRRLSNQMKKLDDEQRTSRRILSSEIYQIRAELMSQQMEKLAMMQRKTSEMDILNGSDSQSESEENHLPERPQTSPVYSNRNRRGSALLSWAGKTDNTFSDDFNRFKYRPKTAHPDLTTSNNQSDVRRTGRSSNIAEQWQNKERSKSLSSYRRPTTSSMRRHSDVPCLRSARVWENRTNESVNIQTNGKTTTKKDTISLNRRATIISFGFPTIPEEFHTNKRSKMSSSPTRRVSSACVKTKWSM